MKWNKYRIIYHYNGNKNNVIIDNDYIGLSYKKVV